MKDMIICENCGSWVFEDDLILGRELKTIEGKGVVAVNTIRCPDCPNTSFSKVGVWVDRTNKKSLDKHNKI